MKSVPYTSLSSYFKSRFGENVYRVSVDAGFTCPNRDGSKGFGGCSFCGEEGARASYIEPHQSLRDQLQFGMEGIRKRSGVRKFIAYFQAYSNTYADLNTLKETFETVLEFPEIVGISVGTRPDCVDEEKLSMMNDLAKGRYFLIEYGVQSVHDQSLLEMNRGHVAETSFRAIEMTKRYPNLRVLAHLIFGLPGESYEMMMESVRKITNAGIHALKFHHLFIERGTVLSEIYKNKPFPVLSHFDYIDLLVDALRITPKECVIHRLFGDPEPERLVAPVWPLDKPKLLRNLTRRMKELCASQGDLL